MPNIEVDGEETLFLLPYKLATILFSQDGTNNPVLTFMYNTVGTITAVRNGIGDYSLLSDGLFTLGKTFYPPFDESGYSSIPITLNPNIYYLIMASGGNSSTLGVYLLDSSFNAVEFSSVISGTPIIFEIRVYP